MNRISLKKYRKLRTDSRSIIWRNPVLAQGLALPFAIAASTSLMNGLALSAIMLGVILIPALLYHAFGARIEDWLRPIVYSTVNIFVVWGFMRFLAGFRPAIIDSLGIYLPMVAVNTITMRMVSDDFSEEGGAIRQAFLNWAGFAVIICLISAIREVLGTGTLLGISLNLGIPSLGPVLYPFSGFIIVGFFAAGLKGANRLVMRLLSRRGIRRAGGAARD